MAITLKKTNVVIIGAGATGGVAALPIARAGIEVIAIEAGPWVSTRDMAPDELRYHQEGSDTLPQRRVFPDEGSPLPSAWQKVLDDALNEEMKR